MSQSLSIEPERPSASGEHVLDDPCWFLHRLDFARGAAIFTRATRDELSAQSFLDQAWDRSGAETVALPLEALRQAEAPPRAPGFIWHTGYCCSTLIARCLDAAGRALSLKEPVVLGDFAIGRDSRNPRATPALASSVVRLLGRPFVSGARVVIKPTAYANSLIDAVAPEAGPMLFLHTGLKGYLAAVMRGGETRRFQARNLLMARAMAGTARISPQDIALFTDVQAAAVLWRLQMQQFRWSADRLGPGRAMLLDARDFLADPAGVLGRLDGFFGLGLGEDRIARVVAGPTLRRHAKEPRARFDAGREQRATAEAEQALGADFAALEPWSAEVAAAAASPGLSAVRA